MMTLAVATIGVAAVLSCKEEKIDQQALTDDQLLYEQAKLELPDQSKLEEAVESYRQELYTQTYLNMMLQHKAEAVTDEDCKVFFDQYGQDLRLEEPIVKGLLIKVPVQTQKNKQLQTWLTQLSQGKDEVMSELEQFCMQRAVVYDNFCSHWVRLSRLTDQLPITVVEPKNFLALKAYELSDQDYEYHFLVTDYRLEGEAQPYEWARQGILDLLIQQKRENFSKELVEQIRGKKETIN